MRKVMLWAVVLGASLTIGSLTVNDFNRRDGMALVLTQSVSAEVLPKDLQPEHAYLMLDTADGSWANERIEIVGQGAVAWSRARSDAWNSVPLGDKWITTLELRDRGRHDLH